MWRNLSTTLGQEEAGAWYGYGEVDGYVKGIIQKCFEGELWERFRRSSLDR
jgi:hypothetical protein